ncbi:MAG: 2-oxo-4-hydroxy-4-carboxy-5-ureidoimidazoline decarboxylase [Gemmatimonadales bacterium]
MKVEELDSIPAGQAAEALRSCCGSSRWVKEMVRRRPFGSVADVLASADEAWDLVTDDDRHEAFSHHPRIGDRQAAATQSSRAAEWSAGEQSAVQSATETVQSELAKVNREYEDRFGHIYIVCATGKTPEQLLEIARKRLANNPEKELHVAAEEQRKITQLRLKKLFGDTK